MTGPTGAHYGAPFSHFVRYAREETVQMSENVWYNKSNISETAQSVSPLHAASDQYSRERTAMASSPILAASPDSANSTDEAHALDQISSLRALVVEAYGEMIDAVNVYLDKHPDDAQSFKVSTDRIAPELIVVYNAFSTQSISFSGAVDYLGQSAAQYVNYIRDAHRAVWSGDADNTAPSLYRSLLNNLPYNEYLLTPHWQDIRQNARLRAQYRCQVCNSSDGQLHVHHRTYENRGDERPEDVILLCATCHDLFHKNGRLAK